MPNKKIIIGLVGQIACGKGTVAKYLMEKYNAKGYKFSYVLRDLLTTLHIENSRKNLQELSTMIRKHYGDDVLAKAMSQDVVADENNLIIVDGIRRLQDIKYLKSLNGFYLVSVEVDSEIRFERLKSRNENAGDDKKTWKQFLKDQKKEADKQIPMVMKQADFRLDNNGAPEELKKQVDELMKKLR